MNPLEFYVVTVGVLTCIYGIQVLAFNLQFAYAGVLNFAFIVLVAVGAYTTGMAELPRKATPTFLGGFAWNFWAAIGFGIVCTVAFSLVLGLVVFRNLRHDYLALALIAIGQGLLTLVTNDVSLFNGVTGLSSIPGPQGTLVLTGNSQLVFLAVAAGALLLTLAVFWRLTASPLGRALRAVREDEDALAGLGKSPIRLKLVAFLFGAAAAGLSGGLLATYIGAWNTQGWQLNETLVLLAAVIVGGRARHTGALLGTVIVITCIIQGATFIPAFVSPVVLASLQYIAVGALVIVFVAVRPQGLLPERHENYRQAARASRGLLGDLRGPTPETDQTASEAVSGQLTKRSGT